MRTSQFMGALTEIVPNLKKEWVPWNLVKREYSLVFLLSQTKPLYCLSVLRESPWQLSFDFAVPQVTEMLYISYIKTDGNILSQNLKKLSCSWSLTRNSNFHYLYNFPIWLISFWSATQKKTAGFSRCCHLLFITFALLLLHWFKMCLIRVSVQYLRQWNKGSFNRLLFFLQVII